MSKAGLLNVIQKMRLERGDIVVVKDVITLHALEGLGKVTDFPVPLIFAPQGIQILKKQDLLNILEQLEQDSAPVSNLDSPHAPL